MFSISKLFVASGFLALALAHADTINLVTSAAALGANDSVTWSPQLGADGAAIPNPFVATSAGGKTVNGSFATAGGSGSVAKVCNGCSWSPLSGDFNNNDFVVWSFDSTGSTGIGPVTLTLAAGVSGFGAVIQADAPGQFTAKIELFDSTNTSLGSVTRTSNAAGDAIFIGALDATAPNATKAVFSLTAAQNNGTPNFLGDFATGPLAVNVPAAVGAPALSITKTHTGNFTQGQTGATYTITVTNSGTAATTGTVTVTDTVPTGLTATAISGTGWTCTQPAGPCTSSTVEAAGASFPAITLTVNVAANAPATVTNSATASGGGAASGSTANDPTTINAAGAPALSITKSHTGNFTQGQTGATYTITVTNSGTAATTGTVTVTDTVPAGLTATAISGTGWTCTQPAGPCTSTTVEAAGASFPAITLTVNVAANAPASVTNSATATGGGQQGSPTANDPTTINAAGAPALSITKTHSGNFTQGDIGDTYTITVTNSGTAATTGTVTVTDTAPAGLTATAISGTGWTCTQPAGPCTSTTVEAAGASFPAITLTVNVAANAPASVTNSATASGGGATNSPTANDPTTINPAGPAPVVSDVFQVRYAANLNIGDSVVDITNTGTSGGNLCANVYTFDPAEELISCCTCSVTPNGLQSLSVRNSLISNTLTAAIPTSVVVKVVANTAAACNASAVTANSLASGLRAWGTTVHSLPTSPVTYGVTETPFSTSALSPTELAHITSFCGFIQADASGFGICKGCSAGGLGAAAAQ